MGDPWIYTLPGAYHPNDLDVTYEINLGNATTFMQFDEDNKNLMINQGSTSEEMLATYMITLRLKDS